MSQLRPYSTDFFFRKICWQDDLTLFSCPGYQAMSDRVHVLSRVARITALSGGFATLLRLSIAICFGLIKLLLPLHKVATVPFDEIGKQLLYPRLIGSHTGRFGGAGTPVLFENRLHFRKQFFDC